MILKRDSNLLHHSRPIIRYLAAGLSAISAGLYLLIGMQILTVIDTPADQIFGYPAAIAYLIGTVLLIRYDQRRLWIIGGLLQIFVIYTYFDVAPSRSPEYEVWGITLRIVQAFLLIALGYLSLRPSEAQQKL